LSEMLAGRYATGCPAIEASFRLDPRPGTLFTLADCDRKWGRTASALARFGEFLALYDRMPADQRAKQHERAAVAATERAALERSVPLLAVRLPNDAPTGTRVWRDEIELAASSLGAAVAVDPGEHVIRSQLPDAHAGATEQRITLAAGEQRTLVVDLAAPLPTAPLAATPPAAAPATLPAPAAPVAPLSDSPGPAPSHRGWAYVAGGIGVASLAVAGVTGGWALVEKGETSPSCDPLGRCTSQRAVNAGNEAHTLTNVETGAWIVGGIALAVALVVWATEPHTRGASLAMGRPGAPTWTPSGVAARW